MTVWAAAFLFLRPTDSFLLFPFLSYSFFPPPVSLSWELLSLSPASAPTPHGYQPLRSITALDQDKRLQSARWTEPSGW